MMVLENSQGPISDEKSSNGLKTNISFIGAERIAGSFKSGKNPSISKHIPQPTALQ
jgi:hypothetical protein